MKTFEIPGEEPTSKTVKSSSEGPKQREHIDAVNQNVQMSGKMIYLMATEQIQHILHLQG